MTFEHLDKKVVDFPQFPKGADIGFVAVQHGSFFPNKIKDTWGGVFIDLIRNK